MKPKFVDSLVKNGFPGISRCFRSEANPKTSHVGLVFGAFVFAAHVTGCSQVPRTGASALELQQGHEKATIPTASHHFLRRNVDQQVRVWKAGVPTHTILSTAEVLSYDGDPLSPIILNPKDGMADLPDSVWTGFCIAPVKQRAKADLEATSSEPSFLYAAPDVSPYAYAKPILRSLADAGLRWIHVPTSTSTYFPIEIIHDKESAYVVHSGDSTGYNSILQISRDSMRLYVNSKERNGNLVAAIATKNRESFRDEELERFADALVREVSQRHYLQWIGIDPHPSVSFHKLVQICKTLEKINQSHRLRIGINATLYGVYIPWGEG
jgi:hypothetical protein